MNIREKEMVSILIELKENYYLTGVKAEFEAEGTRLEEAMRLKEITLKAGLGFHLKIGGCEAIKDMYDALNLGVQSVIAPMVETPYALKKYIDAANNVFAEQSQEVEFLINIETITSVENFAKMLTAQAIEKLSGIVIGRVDLTGSLGWTNDTVNNSKILDISNKLAVQAKTKGLKVIVGGGVSVQSMPFFQAFPPGNLDGFETRKLIFSCPGALKNPKEAFLKAIEFELLWLKNKKKYYGLIQAEDDARLKKIEKRYQESLSQSL